MEFRVPEDYLCKFWDLIYKIPSGCLKECNTRRNTKFKSMHKMVFSLYVDHGFGIRRCMYWTGLSYYKVQIILSNVLYPKDKTCSRCKKQIEGSNRFFCNNCMKYLKEEGEL